MYFKICMVFLTTIFGQLAAAESNRFLVQGSALFYNTSISSDEHPTHDITLADAEELALLLMEYPNITKLILNSEGGDIDAAMRIAETVVELGLMTEVRSTCLSACPLIFAAGWPRTLARGGMLGFHRASTTAASISDAFGSTGVYGKSTQAPSMIAYDMAVDGAVERFEFLRSRGVSDAFNLKLLSIPPREMWIPTRQEIADAGLIHDN